MGSDSGNYLSQIYGYLTREKKQIRKAIEKICQNRAQHIFVLPKKKKNQFQMGPFFPMVNGCFPAMFSKHL